MFARRCGRFRLLMPVFILAFAALLTLAVFGIWNNVLTAVLGVKAITYWQALGILVLSKILFGGFPGRGRGWGRPPFTREQWENMQPEKREAMREEMRRRFGEWPRPFCRQGGKMEPSQAPANPSPAPGSTETKPPA